VELAHFLATCPDPQFRDVPRAVELAKQLVGRGPQYGGLWSTLGVAHYANGDWHEAVRALEKAETLPGGRGVFTGFYLAMACWKKGDKDQARRWFDRGVAWLEEERLHDEDSRRLRAEAAQMLGIPTK
jgi:uncharacterized protein HemY